MLSRRSTLALSASWLLLPNAFAAAPLKLATEDWPPFVLAPKHPLGLGMDVDIAREALRLGGGPELQLERVPFRRALLMVERGEADLTLGLSRTPEREKIFRFSDRYGSESSYQFLTAANRSAKVQSLADLRTLRVGLVSGYFYPAPVLAALNGKQSMAINRAALLRMVAVGHVDVAVMERLAANWLVRDLGLEQELRVEPSVVKVGFAHMAFSRKSPAGMAAVQAMNRGIAMLEREGWGRFEKRYGVDGSPGGRT